MIYQPPKIIYGLLLITIPEVLMDILDISNLMKTKAVLKNKVIYKRFSNITSFINTISTLISQIYQIYGDVSY